MAVNPRATGAPQAQARYRLACGHDVEQVWAELEAGRTSRHTESCTHCATARASLEQLAEATRQLVDDPVEPPPGLLDRIMDAVRADLGLAEPVPLPSPRGGVDVSAPALAAVLRFAADTVDGVRAHRCRIEPLDGGAVRVSMSVSLRYGSGRIDALDAVRERVRTALSDRIGLVLHRLDLELTDVWFDDASGAAP